MCSVSTAADLSLLRKITFSGQTLGALSSVSLPGLYLSCISPWDWASYVSFGWKYPKSGQVVAKRDFIRQSFVGCLAWEGRTHSGKQSCAWGISQPPESAPHPSWLLTAEEEEVKHCSSLTFQTHSRSSECSSPHKETTSTGLFRFTL